MKIHVLLFGWALASGVAQMSAQTKVSLKTQSRSVDFSGASSTKLMRMGTSLPATCSVGEFFFQTSASPGSNVFMCPSANVWMPAGTASVFGRAGAVTAQSGDYTFSQMSGVAGKSQLPASVMYTDSPIASPGFAAAPTNWLGFDSTASKWHVWDGQDGTVPVLHPGDAILIQGGVRAQPATPPSGQAALYVNSTDKKMHSVDDAGLDTAYGPSTGGTGTLPDPTAVYEWEEFIPSNTLVGKLIWGTSCAGTGDWAGNVSVDHAGVYRCRTSSASPNVARIYLGDTANSIVTGLSTDPGWEAHWIWEGKQNTTVKYRVGFASGSSVDAPSNGAWVRWVAGMDTNQRYVVCNSGNGDESTNCTQVDSGVSFAANTWYHLRIRALAAGKFGFSISTSGGAYSTEKTFCSSGCDGVATNLPSGYLGAMFQAVLPSGSTAVEIQTDYWSLKMTGRAR